MMKKHYVIWIQIVYVETRDIYDNIANNFEKRFDTSNYELGYYKKE